MKTPWTLTLSTETGWGADDYDVKDSGGEIVFLDTSYYPVAPDKDQAAFIVKAVNAHDKLVEALRKLTNEIKALVIFESELRAELGNTNYNVLMLRAKEAEAALEGLE